MWLYLGLAGMHHVTAVPCGVYVDFKLQLGRVCSSHSAAWKASDIQVSYAFPLSDEPLDWWCRGLVIVGSPETLKANSNWLEWLEWVRSQNAILHSDDLA